MFLCIQALLAAGVKKTKCTKTMHWLQSRQNSDGSFVNLMTTIAVLPSLIGAFPYDVKHIDCPKNITGNYCCVKYPLICKITQVQIKITYVVILRNLESAKVTDQQETERKLSQLSFVNRTTLYSIIKQHHKKVLLSSFHLNGHTLGFHPQTRKLEPPYTAQLTAPQESTAQ